MTKEITKAYILQQMQDKFKLRDLAPAVFTFEESVVPVYNIEQHLKIYRSAMSAVSVTTVGALNFFSVPENERWFISRYTVVFYTGAYTVAGVYVGRHSDVTLFMYLDLTAAQSVSYTNDLPKDVVLDSGDKLNINIDGFTSQGVLRLYIDYIKEEIR